MPPRNANSHPDPITMSSRTIKAFLFLLLLLLAATLPATADDEAAAAASAAAAEVLFHNERNDLLQLRDSLSSTMSLHSNWTGPPCYRDRSRWFGITCSESKVTAISLPGIQLTGALPSAALQNVLHLARLNLSGNALRGGLPTLRGLRRLRVVSFAGNRFAGSIPTEYSALPELLRLELQDNLLIGEVPPFDQPKLELLNVSYNFLEGPIPSNPVLQGLPGSAFDHNSGLCGRPLMKLCPTAAPPAQPPPPPSFPPIGRAGRGSGAPPFAAATSKNKSSRDWVVVLVTFCIIGLAFLVTMFFLYYWKRHSKKAKQKEYENSDTTEIEVKSLESRSAQSKKVVELTFLEKEKATFDLDDLLRSSAELIAKGNLGNTYRTTLASGSVLVVKRLKTMNGMSKKEFLQQMQLLGKVKHENLVEIISFHYSKEEKLVIYEHIYGGSLFHLLHDGRGEARVPLQWQARLNIVKGIARGLTHLHQCMPAHKVPHANLKSSNVVVVRPGHHHQPNFQAKLTDAGFYSILPSAYIPRLAVSRTPEFSQGRKLTHKADVYCFGLVLLEVITGQAPSERVGEDLPGWVRLVVNNDWSTDMLDLEIVAEKESHEDMLKLTEVALTCTDSLPERRPAMIDVVKRIEDIGRGC